MNNSLSDLQSYHAANNFRKKKKAQKLWQHKPKLFFDIAYDAIIKQIFSANVHLFLFTHSLWVIKPVELHLPNVIFCSATSANWWVSWGLQSDVLTARRQEPISGARQFPHVLEQSQRMSNGHSTSNNQGKQQSQCSEQQQRSESGLLIMWLILIFGLMGMLAAKLFKAIRTLLGGTFSPLSVHKCCLVVPKSLRWLM